MAGGIRAGTLLFGTPVASAPTGTGITGVDRVWINSANHHFMFTDSSNVDHDLSVGGGGGSGAGWVRTAVADTAPTVAPTAAAPALVAYTSITASRTVTGTTAGTAAAPVQIKIEDEGGTVTATNTITFTPSSGLIDGVASKVVVASAKGWWEGYCNGTNWFSANASNLAPLAAPILSGTATGTYSLGGTPTLASTLAVASDQGQSIGAPTLRTNAIYTTTLDSGSLTNMVQSRVVDGASAVAVTLNSFNALANAAAKLVSVQNNGVEKSYADKEGYLLPGTGRTAASVIAPSWTAVTYSNSYVDYGAPYSGTAYWKTATGIVHVRLAAKSGTSATTVATLPAGFRPGGRVTYAGIIDNAIGFIHVDQTGAISSIGGTTDIIGELIFPAEF